MATSSTTSARIRPSKDPGWDYGQPENGNRNDVKCDFCGQVPKGGIHRFKQHLIGGFKDVAACKKVPIDVKDRMRKYVDDANEKKKETHRLKEINLGIGKINVFESGSNADLTESMSPPQTTPASSVSESRLKPKVKGPLDTFFLQNFDNLVQQPIDNIHRKVARDNTCEFICDFVYENGLAFHVVESPSFARMLAAVGQFGPGLKGPTYHEVRVPFLKKKVSAISNWIDEFKVHWKNYGCSIMCDWWTDGKRRTLINFLVNCPKGTVFLKSIDGSSHIKSATLCHDMLLDVITEVGAENVVQIVTDNAANLKLACEWIAEELFIYWTPCAAHCVDLMCEDICKIKKFADVVLKCRTVTRFIYNHVNVVSMMREFTNGKELTRPAATRFATCYLSMECIYDVKSGLRGMVISEEWANSKWATDFVAKEVCKILNKSKFWKDLHFCIKVLKPLVDVIRIVDMEEKPAMGYIYHIVDQMIKQIPLVLSDPKDSVMLDKVLKIIKERWSEQLHQPLHAAGYYLNPSIYFSDPPNSGERLDANADIKRGLYAAVSMLNREEVQDTIINQLSVYRSAGGLMGEPLAKRNRMTTSPVEWWINWGSEVPELQRFAKRVLGLTVSASPCERNWSAFNNLHTKKRNRLDHEKLNDLVYVNYNTKLRARYLDRTSLAGKDTDPLIVNDYDACQEWLIPFKEKEQLDGKDHEVDETSEEEGAQTGTRQYKKNAAIEKEERQRITKSKKVREMNDIYKSVGDDGETLGSALRRSKRKAAEVSDSSHSFEDDASIDIPIRSLKKKKRKVQFGEDDWSSDEVREAGQVATGSGGEM